MTTSQSITTAEELLAAGDLGRCELVRGCLVRMPFNSMEHGIIASDMCCRLAEFVAEHKLGETVGAGTGFHIESDPDTVLAPDVGFVRTERAPAEMPTGYFPGPPDLAVEVLSPDDRPAAVKQKVEQWLAAGCVVVWVVSPAAQTITVHRSGQATEVLGVADMLSGGRLLPGFTLAVREIFAD